MAQNKTKAELQAELRVLRRAKASQGVFSVANNIIRWAGVVIVFRYGYLSVDALAGKATAADIGIKILANVKLSEVLAWLFGASGTAYGLFERKLRKDTVERLQVRNREFESRIDPGRSTSSLTPRGDTRPEDR